MTAGRRNQAALTLFAGLERHGGRVALIGDDGRTWRYDQVVARGDALAAAAADDDDTAPRPLALVVCRNAAECVIGYVGLMRAGIAVLLLHHSAGPAQTQSVLDRFAPSLVYAPTQWNQSGRPVAKLGQYVLTRRGGEPPPLHPDLALLLTTSGSTGSRSVVRLSNANIVANAHAIARFLEIGPDERAVTTLPLSYSYGLSVLHSHLVQGAAVVLTEDSVLAPDFWRLMREQRVTSLAGVPVLYDMLRRLRFGAMDLPDLRTLTQAGGRMAAERVAEFAELCAASGRKLVVMYGQTEATARIAWLPWPLARQYPDAIGRAIPGGRLWLEDEDGGVIDRPGMVGELVYAGDNVSMGLARSAADLARGDDLGGVLRTGDLATVGAEGFYRIVGRRKRFLKLFGTRVGLDELEQVLAQAGLECACTGSDDHLLVHAVAEGEDAVKARIVALTGLNPHGFRVRLVPALPRQESGKIDYPALDGRP